MKILNLLLEIRQIVFYFFLIITPYCDGTGKIEMKSIKWVLLTIDQCEW